VQARPCHRHAAWSRALTCPAPPSRSRGSRGWALPCAKVSRGTPESKGENQFPFPFFSRAAGEGDVCPQPGFQSEGRPGDAATAGCRAAVTPAAQSKTGYHQLGSAPRGRSKGQPPACTQHREVLIRQGVIKKQVHPAVSCLPERDENQINKLSQLLSPHSHSVYLLFSLLSLPLPSHMKKAKLFVYLLHSPL